MLTHRYSDNISCKKILLVGPVPPPLGGVAIHIKRVVRKLQQQENCVHVHNTATAYASRLASLSALVRAVRTHRPDIVFYHEPTESIQKLFVVVLLKMFLRFTLVTIDHDCRLLYRFRTVKKFLFNKIMKWVDTAVVIGDTTQQCYVDNRVMPARQSVESPFLPPDTSCVQLTSPTVQHFIATHSPLITATAFVPTPLYGFDLCIELIVQIKESAPDVGLLFGICKIAEHKKYFSEIQKKIEALGLRDNFYFLVNEPGEVTEFWPLIKQSDLFVRPTSSDSFGISIQEALFLGVPAVASDVCKRPPETVLFQTGDVDDFIRKTKRLLST